MQASGLMEVLAMALKETSYDEQSKSRSDILIRSSCSRTPACCSEYPSHHTSNTPVEFTMTRELKYARLSKHGILTSRAPAILIPEDYLSHLLYDKLSVHHDKVILINGWSGEGMSCWQIRDTAAMIARSFLDYGVTEGQFVFGYSYNNFLYACAILACTFIGAVYAGCTHTHAPSDLMHKLSDSAARILLCCSENLESAVTAGDLVESVNLIIVMDGEFRETRMTPARKRLVSIQQMLDRCHRPNDPPMPLKLTKSPNTALAFSQYSSGSTGMPKAVLKTHAAWVAYLISSEPGTHFAHNNHDDIVSCHMSFAHATGCMTLLSSLYFGITAVLSRKFEVANFLANLEKYRISYSYIAPSFIIQLSKSGQVVKDLNVSSLKVVITVGSPLPIAVVPPFLRMFPSIRKLSQAYGSTETGSIACVDDDCHNYATVGRPIRGVRIRVVNRETGKNLSFKQVGEIHIDGPEKLVSYHKRPDADAENMTEDGWIKTGDAGYFDEDGLIYLVDRWKEMIKVDSNQVSPSELEALLLSHEEVAEAAVIGVTHEVHGQVPKAFIVPRDPESVTDPSLIMYSVNQQVDQVKWIHELLIVRQLPMISVGKIDRVALRNGKIT